MYSDKMAYSQLGEVAMMTLRNLLSVTVAFFLGGVVVSFVLYLLVELGFLHELAPDVDDWFALGIEITSLAVLSGLIVDAMRCLAAVLWRGKPPYRLKLRKILKQNLV